MSKLIYSTNNPCDDKLVVYVAIFLMEIYAMSDRWLSVEEIAKYLGVSKDSIYAWISKRNMPAHRIGRLWKFKAEEVDEWVRSDGAAEYKSQGKE